jgi:hypothetical protein
VLREALQDVLHAAKDVLMRDAPHLGNRRAAHSPRR